MRRLQMLNALHFTALVLMEGLSSRQRSEREGSTSKDHESIELKLSRLPGSTSSPLGTTRAATASTLALSFLLLVILNCTLVDVLAGLPAIFPATYPLDEIL